MTAALSELRRLNEAQSRGEIDPNEVGTQHARVLASIEEAEIVEADAPAPPSSPTLGANQLWLMLALVLLSCFGMTTVIAVLFGDLMFALTITVSLLAAVIVRAFTRLTPKE